MSENHAIPKASDTKRRPNTFRDRDAPTSFWGRSVMANAKALCLCWAKKKVFAWLPRDEGGRVRKTVALRASASF